MLRGCKKGDRVVSGGSEEGEGGEGERGKGGL